MRYTISFFIKIILLLVLVFSISSCWNKKTQTSWLQTKTLDNFSVSIPKTWPLISKDSDGVPKPSSGKIVLIASAPDAKNGFANNMVILERKIKGQTTSKQFSLAGKTNIEKQFFSYKEIESGDIKFQDEEISHISIFLAQYNRETPKAIFLQTSRICNNNAYTITLSVEKNSEDFSKYKWLISTFACKSKK